MALASVEVEVAPTKLVPSIVPSLPSLNPPQEIPSLETQKKIVSVLDVFENIIRVNSEINENLVA